MPIAGFVALLSFVPNFAVKYVDTVIDDELVRDGAGKMGQSDHYAALVELWAI